MIARWENIITLKLNNMSKVRENYIAEIIVVLVITIILLTSCGSTKKCCIKTANEVYKYEGMYTNQDWEDIN